MAEALTDDLLRARGMGILEANLGPVEALRFLALLSHEPFDYQSWRDKHFQGMSLEEILGRAANTTRP
ncbi:MAG TPA: hypothetical protein DD490_25975 [Acidobacteria bacterium]|nr:hypothetical protein [Acidobacteriota bacterium]